MDKVDRLLTFLDNAGIGNPVKINEVIKELYPHSMDFSDDQEHKEYGTRVENFLDSLKKANLITYRREGSFRAKVGGKYLTLNDCNIFATITYEGSKSLQESPVSQVNYALNIDGSFTGNLVQGNGNSQQVYNEPKKSEKPKWLTLNFYWEELIKYWYKLILGAIGLFLLSWLGFHFFSERAFNKSPGGIENNIPYEPKNDTPFVIESHKTEVKNQNGKNEVNSITGDNYGTNGGDHNSVTNNFGIKQRQLSSKDFKKIIYVMGDTSVNITLLVVTGDAESENYAKGIIKSIAKKGFIKTHIQYAQSLPGGYDTLRIDRSDDKKYGNILIYPAKNVRQ